MTSAALAYFKGKEWSMGNGQCPECCGVHEGWLGHPLYLTDRNIGHTADCKLAASLKELGAEPVMIGSLNTGRTFERYRTPGGFLATREVHHD